MALDLYLTADGSTADEALRGLQQVVGAYLRECARTGRSPMRPAPGEYWNEWYKALASDQDRGHPFAIDDPAHLDIELQAEVVEALAA